MPLNATGIAQAQFVAPYIAAMKPTKIYSSHLARARSTARVLGDLVGVEPMIDPRLRERSYGIWEGMTSEEIRAQWPEDWQVWRQGKDPSDGIGVESRTECGARFSTAVREAFTQSREDDVIVFVAHGGCILTGIIALLGLDPSRWNVMNGMDNCHWALMVPRPEAEIPWRLRSYNRIYGDGEFGDL